MDTEKEFRFRFSLRGLLIALVVLGAGFGILGRLFRQNPQLFSMVVGALSTIVPYVLAVGTIIWLGAKRRQAGLLLWGISLVVIPLIGFGVIALTQRFIGTSPGNLSVQSTTQLIDQQLPKQLDAPWVWRELEQRATAGTLSKEETEAAVGQLIAHMKATKPQGWDQPLSWQRDFLASVRQKGLLSDSVTFELCDAFYGPNPIIQPLPRVREGTARFGMEIEYGSVWSDHTGVDLSLLWHVDRVLLDGAPIEVDQRYIRRGAWGGSHNRTVAVGEHEITFEVTCAYIDKSKLIGLDTLDLPPDRWPNVAKRWKRAVSAPFNVFTADEPLVRLITAPNLDPSSGIQVKRCVVQAGKGNEKKVILELDLNAAVSMSCDVSITLAGANIPLGSRWIARSESGRSSSGGSSLSAVIEGRLDPVIEYADILLTPAPEHVEHRAEVAEIWGQPITIQSVPVERLDLEVRPSDE